MMRHAFYNYIDVFIILSDYDIHIHIAHIARILIVVSKILTANIKKSSDK